MNTTRQDDLYNHHYKKHNYKWLKTYGKLNYAKPDWFPIFSILTKIDVYKNVLHVLVVGNA